MRACYEASGAGYVLQRSLTEWGVECHLAAPSLSPRRPGEHRKTDRRDAIKIARDFRDGRLVLIHIPTETDERVRDLVRCRETFQREIVKSRHYILKFMRRRGFVFRSCRCRHVGHQSDSQAPSGGGLFDIRIVPTELRADIRLVRAAVGDFPRRLRHTC